MANANVRNNGMLSAPADGLGDEEFEAMMRKNFPRKNSNSVKSLTPLLILEILKRFSSPERRMTQKQIQAKLFCYFEVTVERKAVRRSLDALIDCGYAVFTGRGGTWYDASLQPDFFSYSC